MARLFRGVGLFFYLAFRVVLRWQVEETTETLAEGPEEYDEKTLA